MKLRPPNLNATAHPNHPVGLVGIDGWNASIYHLRHVHWLGCHRGIKGNWMTGMARFFRAARDTATAPAVTVMGALRSGTNYLKFLLESNYFVQADFVSFGWKHGGVPVLPAGGAVSYPEVPLFYIVKNPYAFALSLHRYHRRKHEQGHVISVVAADSWSGFLCSPIEIFDSQRAGSPRMRFANPIQYWNFIYWNLETLDRRMFRVIGLNYERLIEAPETLREVESIVPLVRRHDTLMTPRNQLRRLAGSPADTRMVACQTDDNFDAVYYTERRYLEEFSEEQQAFVQSQADPWIMERRGYAVA